MRYPKSFVLGVAVSTLTILFSGCAEQPSHVGAQGSSSYSGSYRHPSSFGQLPNRSGTNEQTRHVQGFPEGHPLNPHGLANEPVHHTAQEPEHAPGNEQPWDTPSSTQPTANTLPHTNTNY